MARKKQATPTADLFDINERVEEVMETTEPVRPILAPRPTIKFPCLAVKLVRRELVVGQANRMWGMATLQGWEPSIIGEVKWGGKEKS